MIFRGLKNLNKYLQKENIEFVSITLDAKNDKVEEINNFKNSLLIIVFTASL